MLAGCRRESVTLEKAPVITPVATPVPAARTAPGEPSATHVVKTRLATLRVEVTLPIGWEVLAIRSDENGGLVAFGPHDDSGASVFLDGSLPTHVPASAPLATRESLAHDACAKPAVCTALATETLPGGFLVSLLLPNAVFVESWRTLTPNRAVRCGFEASPPGGGAFLNDETAVARARKLGEAICRSVTNDDGS
jgi:hypothetical protein